MTTDVQIGGTHYKDCAIQPIDFMSANMTLEQYEGFCIGNAMKYLSRYGRKGDKKEQIEKAKHYMEFLLERLNKENSNDK